MRPEARRVAAWLATLAAIAAPGDTAAQTGLSRLDPGPGRIDLSASVGALEPTAWGDLVLLETLTAGGINERILAREITLEPTEVIDATVTYWEGRYGFRVHGGFAQTCLAFGGRCEGPASGAIQSSSVDVDIWTADIGGSIGLRPYRSGTIVWPFAFFGVGAVSYRFDQPIAPPLTSTSLALGDAPILVVGRGGPEQSVIVLEELNRETTFALTLGIGTDVRLPIGPVSVGLRLEGSDQIHPSPVDVRVTRISGFGRDVRFTFGWVHNLRASAGLVVTFGR